jgi:thioredoxin reductase (NADPH)
MQRTRVAVVGAGPVGLELAIALKRAGVSYVHFDARQIGYTISWFAPQTRFFSSPERIAIAGVPLQTADQSKATREEYLAYLRGVVEQFDLKVRTYVRVISLRRERDGFTLVTRAADGEHAWRAEFVVLVTGDMESPRKLNIPGEDLAHVSHYFEDPHRYFRKRLLIVGGKNSAVEAAIRSHRAGADVALSYRHDRLDPKHIKYWLLPEIESFFKHGRIVFHGHTQPVAITPTHVTLRRADGSTFDLPADFVLLLTGYVADHSLFEMAGAELEGENRSPKHNGNTMETTVPGLFVAGTAAAGTQVSFRLFIENCHVHVERIVAAITGKKVSAGDTTPRAEVESMPES